MPESHWIALAVERIDALTADRIVSIWMDKNVMDSLYRERERLIREWDAARMREAEERKLLQGGKSATL